VRWSAYAKNWHGLKGLPVNVKSLLPRLESTLHRLIRYAAEGNRLLLMTLALAFLGTLSSSIPVTSIVIPAVLLVPLRWKGIAAVAALGSALGATLLVMVFHHIGWAQLYQQFPELNAHPSWKAVMDWSAHHGTWALLLIAALPLPQTPALVFFAIARPDYGLVFMAMLAGKALKYSLFAWVAARFPQHFKGVFGNDLPNTKDQPPQ